MTIMDYRTQDGLANYGFSIEFQPGIGWRVYFIFELPQQDHDDSLKLPYLSTDGNRHYVDCSPKLDSLGEGKTVAALWAELAHRYQRTHEQRALYVELIERYHRTQAQKRATPADPDHLSDAAVADAASAGHQDCDPVIPHPSAAAKSSLDLHESEWAGRVTDEVA